MSRLEQKQQTRRKLIETALALSAERGFAAVSLREVARGAGITAAGFYRHFRDMDDLGLVLVDEVGLALRQLIREARSRYSDRGRVRASVEAFLEYINASPHLFRLLLGERLGGAPAFRRALHAEIDRFVAELCDDLEAQARSAGLELQDAALVAEAVVAVAFTVGAEALELPKHRQQALLDRIVGEINIIMRGASVPPSPGSPRAGEPKR